MFEIAQMQKKNDKQNKKYPGKLKKQNVRQMESNLVPISETWFCDPETD